MLDERNVGMNGLPTFTSNSPMLPWYRSLMGDDTCSGIYLNASRFSNKEICRILNAYPEVDFAIYDANYREVALCGHDMPNRTSPFSEMTRRRKYGRCQQGVARGVRFADTA